jgi:hypothetical protein
MGKFINLKGLVFGRLTVLERVENKSKRIRWLCQCSCGNTTEVVTGSLRGGLTTSCGCYWNELRARGASTKHGLTYEPAYRTWIRAKNRAKEKGLEFNIEISDITMPEYCPIFGIKLVIHTGYGNGPAPDSPSLDRIDPSKGYIKGNVWVISTKANKLKSNATIQELEQLVNAIKNKLVDRTDK